MEKKMDRHPGEKVATIWFDQSVLDRVDRLAEKGGISRSLLVRNLTVVGLEYLETCDRYGLYRTAIVMRDFAAWFKEQCDSGVLLDIERAK